MDTNSANLDLSMNQRRLVRIQNEIPQWKLAQLMGTSPSRLPLRERGRTSITDEQKKITKLLELVNKKPVVGNDLGKENREKTGQSARKIGIDY